MANPEEARRRVSRWVEQSKTLRIFIFGKLGTGKSSLINSLLNKEVAKEGYGFYAETEVIEPHSDEVEQTIIQIQEKVITINNIHVTLWDTPGLQDPHADKSKILEDIRTKVCGNADLYVYCTKMTQMRVEQGDYDAIADLTEVLGEDFWKRTFFAMTFANELKLPINCTKTLDSYFQEKLNGWTEVLRSAVERAGVNPYHAKRIPVVPTGYRDQPLPGSDQTEGHWFSKFWSTCIERMEFMSIPAFLAVNQEEWMDHTASQNIAARVIAERLIDWGNKIEGKIVSDLAEVPREDVFKYLRDAIIRDVRNEVPIPVANDTTETDAPTQATLTIAVPGTPLPHSWWSTAASVVHQVYLRPFTFGVLLFGTCCVIGLLMQRSRRSL